MVEPIPDEELEYITLHEGIDVNSFSCCSKPEEVDLEEFLKEDALRCQNSFFSVTRVVLWKGTQYFANFFLPFLLFNVFLLSVL